MIDYFSKFPYAELSSQDGLHKLKLCTYNYEFPIVTTGYDADWQRNYLLVSIPAFRAEIDEPIFEGSYMHSCVELLTKFIKLEIDSVHIEPTEPFLSLNFAFDSLKKVIVKVVVEYPLGWGASLEFEFQTDLTYVDQFVVGLKNILDQFPSRQ